MSVRDPQKFDVAGVEVRQGDFDQPETLDFRGFDKLLIVSSGAHDSAVRIQQHANAIAKAKEHGVGHIFYTSVTDADTSTLSVAEVHKAAEEAIRATGITFTFLRNGMYHENYLDSLAQDVVGHLDQGRPRRERTAGRLRAGRRRSWSTSSWQSATACSPRFARTWRS